MVRYLWEVTICEYGKATRAAGIVRNALSRAYGSIRTKALRLCREAESSEGFSSCKPNLRLVPNPKAISAL